MPHSAARHTNPPLDAEDAAVPRRQGTPASDTRTKAVCSREVGDRSTSMKSVQTGTPGQERASPPQRSAPPPPPSGACRSGLGGRLGRRPGGVWRVYLPARDALQGKGPQRRLDRRLEEVAEAVGGGYFRLQTLLRPVLGVRGTVAGHRLGGLEGGGGPPSPSNASPPPPPEPDPTLSGTPTESDAAAPPPPPPKRLPWARGMG